MRILHVIQNMSPRHGGPTTVLKALAHAQAIAGLDVTLCTTNEDYPAGQMDVSTDVPVKENGVTVWYHRVHFFPLVFSVTLAKWLKREIAGFDIVHIHGLYRFPVTYAAWRARRAGVPYIIMPHGSLAPFLFRQSRFGKMALPLKRIYERLFDIPNLNGAAAIHYTVQEEAERTAFMDLRASAVVVPNGLDWAEYEGLPERGRFRQPAADVGDPGACR